MPKTSVSTKVDDQLLALLQERAESDDITQSQVILEALKKHLSGFVETTSADGTDHINGVARALDDVLNRRFERLDSFLEKTTKSLSASTPIVKRIDLEMARVLSGDKLVIGCLAELVGYEKFNAIAARAKSLKTDESTDENEVLRAPQRDALEEEYRR